MSKLLFLLTLVLLGLSTGRTMAEGGTPALIKAEKDYAAAKARYQTNATDNAIAKQLASACFDKADNTSEETVRERMAKEGIEVCRQWIHRTPNAAAAHYYLAMNLGQLARTKSLGALSIVKEMEKEWLAAAALDPHCDYAGADRNLGLLYRDTPGFPISVGSRSKSEKHLQDAVNLDPEYPENHLNLIETHLKRKTSTVAAEYEKLKAILPAARKRFTGPDWQSSWDDWNARLKVLENKNTGRAVTNRNGS